MLKNIFSRALAVVAVVGLVALTGCNDDAEPKAEITSVSFDLASNLVTINGKNFGTNADDVVILFEELGGGGLVANPADAEKAGRIVYMDGVEYRGYSPISITNERMTVEPGCFYSEYNVKVLVKQMAADAPSAIEINNCF